MDIAEWALGQAKADKRDVLIVDTSGRLHVDAELMEELAQIKKRTKPHDVLLVVDAMTGQDAVNVAEQFAETANFDGVLLTKLDGDARGGAALSVKAVTGKPILYASTGEKLDAFERFHPDRMAQRILGMGDVMTLVEKAEREFDEDEGGRARAQDPPPGVHLRRLPRPAAPDPAHGAADRPAQDDPRDGRPAREHEGRRARARPHPGDHHVDDMEERANPALLNGSRRRRIALGLRNQRERREPAREAVRRRCRR